MDRIGGDYAANVARFSKILHVGETFDLTCKTVAVGSGELTLFCVNGMTREEGLQKLMTFLLSQSDLPDSAEAFLARDLPCAECRVTGNEREMIRAVLSGMTLIFGSAFGAAALLADLRTYPARMPQEPENDRVMRGARDGFVETLLINTALIRRRIRDPDLIFHHETVGRVSGSDVAICYMKNRADPALVAHVKEKLASIDTDALTMGHQFLAEALIRTRWYNPFPKIRYTERPDAAAAQLLEGSVILLLDTSPAAMILPTSIFDFLQESNDFCLPPLTGTYLRVVRHIVFWLTLILTPLWLLAAQNPQYVPAFLRFSLPSHEGKLPLPVQLLLAEFIIDGLRMASMNTPDMLANSLSVVGGLILGDFAVDAGWLIPEVILYMAFVAIANFTQTSFELGYALKFLRIFLLISTALFNLPGFFGGVALTFLLIFTNKTLNGKHSYLYPLIPFNGKALLSLYTRRRKKD